MNPETIYNLLQKPLPRYTQSISIGCDECYQEWPCFEIQKIQELATSVHAKYPTAKYINIRPQIIEQKGQNTHISNAQLYNYNEDAFFLQLFDNETLLGHIKITRHEIVWLNPKLF
jgi:hypothetical protein